MRKSPPHILFTNYSMLEYLLIRPQDSELFDDGRGADWRFLILDEAHVYRGANGMEMAMLLRRLKERLRDGGRREPFRCIATSATIASGSAEEDRAAVADFAGTLFGEPFGPQGVVFGEYEKVRSEQERQSDIRRYHIFVRALEGAFLLHEDGRDRVVLNRVSGESDDGPAAVPLEIALCRECGQHYYVGKEKGGHLVEAVRDPSRPDFGVDYYLPSPPEQAGETLCRACGALSWGHPGCNCDAAIEVQRCDSHLKHPDQLKKCFRCEYTRGGVGDPVQEIVHGADGPNAVLATALHGLLPPAARRILAFADSRQDAAFFAWYAEDSYNTLRDRNLMLRVSRRMSRDKASRGGLSVKDFAHRLVRERRDGGVDSDYDTHETALRRSYTAVLAEAVSEDVRLSLSGVGLVDWYVQLPVGFSAPREMLAPHWNLTAPEADVLVQLLLAQFRIRGAITLPLDPEFPTWRDVSRRPQLAFARSVPRGSGMRNTRGWGGPQSGLVKHFLPRLLAVGGEAQETAQRLMEATWDALMDHHERSPEARRLLERAGKGGAFRLKSEWLRVRTVAPSDLWECGVCARVTAHNVRAVCPRNRCPGELVRADAARIARNHYRSLYETPDLPATLSAQEHTAQLSDDEARRRQTAFKEGSIHLLSSSTTFEVGVDLGDLEVAFLRNVPPEPFNYAQRVGRAGRREKSGLALTYCRRRPHDLHYFAHPDDLIAGTVVPPRLFIRNPRIVARHVTAAALSAFFRDRQHSDRFESVRDFVGGDWNHPSGAAALQRYCERNQVLTDALLRIVPSVLHTELGLKDGSWTDRIAGPDSHLAKAANEVCSEYRETERIKDQSAKDDVFWKASRATKRMKTIEEESPVRFLARKAVIPKYGFPVDVVELHTGLAAEGESVELSRDLTLAISEYAPGTSVVANKLEWKSCGIRKIVGKEQRVRLYSYDGERGFRSKLDGDTSKEYRGRYLVPEFGFVTSRWEKPKPPERRSERLFSTRPFFRDFPSGSPQQTQFFGVQVSQAVPGELVVLCEGRGQGFMLCEACGVHKKEPLPRQHDAPEGRRCTGIFRRYSLGHELKTDVVRVQFPEALSDTDRYSVGQALLLGGAEVVAVPERDLNVTLAPDSIILYDGVPGGAGLVAQLTSESSFLQVLERARLRVAGGCGCDRSCYGCLRSYRNQFVHTELDRRVALKVLDAALERR